MADLKIKAGTYTAQSVLTTELNALANGSASALSAAFDNATNGDARVWFELNVTPGSAPTDQAPVDVHVVYLNSDATNYGDWNTTGPVVDPTTYAGSATMRNAAAAHRRVTPATPLRARSFKVGVVNRMGVAFPASGSTLLMYTEIDTAV